MLLETGWAALLCRDALGIISVALGLARGGEEDGGELLGKVAEAETGGETGMAARYFGIYLGGRDGGE